MKIALISKFVRPPWGGGNQFLLALKYQLEKLGHQVVHPFMLTGKNYLDMIISKMNSLCGYSFANRADVVLFNSYLFDETAMSRIDRHKKVFVHRVDGPIDIYRGKSAGVDKQIWEANQKFADCTVFQSRYSMDKHLEMGLNFVKPSIIYNASDPRYFYPLRGERQRFEGRKLKIISSSWSTNPRKGKCIYEWLDQNLDWDAYDYSFVGQKPCEFMNIRHIPAVHSEELGNILRSHDVFLTASEADPCSNALIEALSCGLPSIYLNSGGHSELVKNPALGFTENHEIPSILEQLKTDFIKFQSEIDPPKLENITQLYLNIFRTG